MDPKKAKLKARLHIVSHPPTFTKLSELEVDTVYYIQKLVVLSTSYGTRISVDIAKPGDVNQTRVILPQRFYELEADIDNINSLIEEGDKLKLVYKGPWLSTSNVIVEWEE